MFCDTLANTALVGRNRMVLKLLDRVAYLWFVDNGVPKIAIYRQITISTVECTVDLLDTTPYYQCTVLLCIHTKTGMSPVDLCIKLPYKVCSGTEILLELY